MVVSAELRVLPLERCVGETSSRVVTSAPWLMAELTTRDGWAILQPTGTDASLELLDDWCRRHRATLHAAIFSENGLLLRGWDAAVVSSCIGRHAGPRKALDGVIAWQD